jgi:hypothetical protein
LHRSLVERSRGSRVAAYGDRVLPVLGAESQGQFGTARQ